MKVYKLEIMVIDHDRVGVDDMTIVLENTNFPNDCISPYVMDVKAVEIGEWDDSNPLNNKKTMRDEFNRLFKPS